MAWPTFQSVNSPSRPPGGGSALIAGQAYSKRGDPVTLFNATPMPCQCNPGWTPSSAGRLSDRRKRPTARRSKRLPVAIRSHPTFSSESHHGRLLLPGAAGALGPTATPRGRGTVDSVSRYGLIGLFRDDTNGRSSSNDTNGMTGSNGTNGMTGSNGTSGMTGSNGAKYVILTRI